MATTLRRAKCARKPVSLRQTAARPTHTSYTKVLNRYWQYARKFLLLQNYLHCLHPVHCGERDGDFYCPPIRQTTDPFNAFISNIVGGHQELIGARWRWWLRLSLPILLLFLTLALKLTTANLFSSMGWWLVQDDVTGLCCLNRKIHVLLPPVILKTRCVYCHPKYKYM